LKESEHWTFCFSESVRDDINDEYQQKLRATCQELALAQESIPQAASVNSKKSFAQLIKTEVPPMSRTIKKRSL
jgi:hypothetical protein